MRYMKSVNYSKTGHTFFLIEHISYNLIFIAKFNDSPILIIIITWDLLK